MRLKMSQFHPEANYHLGRFQRLKNLANRGAHHRAAKRYHVIAVCVAT